MNVIEVKNLTKYYGNKRGIENINFDIKEGEIFGFIGPNGAGKSTTIRTILGLLHQNGGDIKIFDKQCPENLPEVLKDVGYLPSEVFYYDGMKVIDLLKYSASFYRKNCSKKIKELAELLELDLNKKIDELSYGNRKKVGIAQALIHEPKLLIMDEPTGGLDPLVQQRFFNLLKEENKNGMTIFFSSHVLSEVQKLCDRVAIIKEGKIIKIEEINNITNSKFKRVKIETPVKLEDDFFNIEGVTDLTKSESTYTFMYNNDINQIINLLSKINIENIWIDEPDLEEIFLHYYTKEG